MKTEKEEKMSAEQKEVLAKLCCYLKELCLTLYKEVNEHNKVVITKERCTKCKRYTKKKRTVKSFKTEFLRRADIFESFEKIFTEGINNDKSR